MFPVSVLMIIVNVKLAVHVIARYSQRLSLRLVHAPHIYSCIIPVAFSVVSIIYCQFATGNPVPANPANFKKCQRN